MICEQIVYRNFRNIGEATLSFQPGVNFLYGKNAAGKTSALEGIYLFATGRSHRTAKERDFIKDGCEQAELMLSFRDNRRTQKLSMRYLGGAKTRKICLQNGIAAKKMSEFIGCFRSVLFCPGHLAIVQAGPGERRSFLDGAIAQSDPQYMADLQQYFAVLFQRNKLLPSYFSDRKTFDGTVEIWSEQLAGLGERIALRRNEYVTRLEEQMKQILSEMSGGKETVALQYKGSKSKEELLKQLLGSHEREARMGTTLFGPHRDDLEIRLNGKSAREFASQGQQRSVAVAMKLAEGELSRMEHGEYPVFLLDDILSELDSGRQSYLLSEMKERQVILSCCEEGLRTLLPPDALCYRVEEGRFARN